MKKQDTFSFNGFEPANTTPVPDVLFDELLSELTGSELKVLLYIIRRTRGFKKDADAISLSQFQKGIVTKEGKRLDHGCGIGDRQTIINALNSLEEKKCIISEKNKTTNGDNATTLYRIYFTQQVVGKPYYPSIENPTTLVGKVNHRSMENPTTVVGNSYPQETVIQQTELQETVKQQCSNVESASADIDATAHTTSLSEKNEAEEIPSTTPTEEQSVTTPTKKGNAARRSVGTNKNKRSKKNATADLLALSEIPAPQKPDPATQGYNVELFMKLGDYYRGSELAESNNPNSNYQKALKAAMALVQRKAPFERVDKLFCFMLGRGEEIGLPKLRDQKWIDGCYNTDLWVVANHYTDKWLECQQMERLVYGNVPNSKQGKSSGDSMSHDEAMQLVSDVLEQTKQEGYSKITATAYTQDGVWLLRVVWEDGSPIHGIKSREMWNKVFKDNVEMDLEDQMKGAK